MIQYFDCSVEIADEACCSFQNKTLVLP